MYTAQYRILEIPLKIPTEQIPETKAPLIKMGTPEYIPVLNPVPASLGKIYLVFRMTV